MADKEIDIQPDPPGAPGLGLGDLLKYGPVFAQVIGGLLQSGKISFLVKTHGKRRRVTIEDA